MTFSSNNLVVEKYKDWQEVSLSRQEFSLRNQSSFKFHNHQFLLQNIKYCYCCLIELSQQNHTKCRSEIKLPTCLNKLINCLGLTCRSVLMLQIKMLLNHSMSFSILIFKNFAIKFSFVQNEPEVEEEEEEEDLVVSW